MEEIRTNFIAWLRNAHAMEQQALTMLNAQMQRLENYPDLRSRIAQHITETESQARQLDALLQRYDSGNSAVKDIAAKFMASAQAFGGVFMGDEVIKGSQMGYVFEHLEIASYTVLISTAQEMGDQQAVNILEGIRQQEVAMADWLITHLPAVTTAFLSREEAGLTAQR